MSFDDTLKKFVDRPNKKLTAVLIFILIFIIEIYIIYRWFWPNILSFWIWGEQAWYSLIFAAIIDSFLIIIIIAIVWGTTFKQISKIISWYAEEEQSHFEKTFKKFEIEEEKFAAEIHEKDDAGLLPAIRYSGEALKTYYGISIQQTRRSFLFSVIAMFIGFFIILIGSASTFGFLTYLFREIKPTDINNIVIAGGVLAEIISVLFLWIYNKSSSQLTYFYNRQIQAHNVILAFRIADTMTDKDKTKHEIVKNILETSKTSQPEIKLPNRDGFKKLLP